MEQITKRDGVYYYGERKCQSVDEAYKLFRNEYHRQLGREVFKRLDRVGQRTERIHGFGFYTDGADSLADKFLSYGRTPCRLMGLVGISYVRAIGLWDYEHIPDDEFERWIDWIFSRHSGGLKMVGRRSQSGRTSKRLKTRYR